MLDVRARLIDEGTAEDFASTAGLSVDGCVVSGHPRGIAAIERLADASWKELALSSASRPLLAADSRETGVKLWLDKQQAAHLQEALAPASVAEDPGADHSSRTSRAALLIALDWILLAAVILVGVLIYRAAEHVMPTAVAIPVGIVVAAPLLWPLQAIGKAIQRRYYDNVH